MLPDRPDVEERVRTSVINSFVRLAVERRRWIYFGWLAILAVSFAVLFTLGLQVDTSRQGLVSEDNEDSARYQAFIREFGTPLYLVIVIEGDDPSANKAYATELTEALRSNRALVRDVVAKMSLETFRPFGLLWMNPDELRSIRHVLKVLADTGEGLPRSQELAGLVDAVDALRDFLDTLPEQRDRLSRLETALREDEQGGGQKKISREELVEEVRDSFRFLRTALEEDEWTELTPLFQGAERAVEEEGHSSRLHALTSAGIDEKGLFTSPDGTQLLLFVKPVSDSEQIEIVDPYVLFVEETVERLRPEGIQAYVTGNPAHVATEMRHLRKDMLVTAVIAIVGVLLLFFLTYGSLVHTAVVAVPLLFGILATLAFTSVMYGRINLLSSSLLPILVGLGVDFGIHFLSRYREAIRSGKTTEEATTEMLHRAGPGVITGALTTIAAFLAMATSEFTGMTELGVISAVGLFIVLLADLTLLPCLFIALGERLHGVQSPLKSIRDGRGRLSSALLQEPLLILVLTVGATIYLASAIKPIAFSFSVTQFIPEESSAAKGYEKLREQEGFSPDFAVMVVDSAEEAREMTDRLQEHNDLIARVLSTSTYLPENQAEKAPIIREIRSQYKRLGSLKLEIGGSPDPVAFVTGLRQLVESDDDDREAPLDPLGGSLSELLLEGGRGEEIAAITAANEEVKKIIQLVEAMDPEVARRRLNNLEDRIGGTLNDVQGFLQSDRDVMSPADLPADLRQNHWRPLEGTEGRFVLHIFPSGSIDDPEFMARFNDLIEELDPNVTGLPVTFLKFGYLLRDGLEKSAGYALVIIFFLLLLDFRSLSSVLMALFPLLLGVTWMVGCMNVFGMGYNFANLMAIPLILGIGIDSGVHIVHRYRQGTAPRQLLATTGKAVFISSLTTIIGFGSMMAASYGGLRSLGATLVVGVGACLIATTIVLPAGLEFLRRSREDDAGG